METALQESNEKLIMWVNELEQRGSEIYLLSEMADLLQTCLSAEEAFTVIGESMKKLFPSDAGALCMINQSRNGVDVAASWGTTPPSIAQTFMPNDCWALRRGRLHLVEDAHAGLLCKHISQPLKGSYLCVPMIAQSEPIGMLYLEGSPHEMQQPQEVRKFIVESNIY